MNDYATETDLDTKEDWEQQPGEPSLWFERFDIFRTMGPARTIAGAHRIYCQNNGFPKKNISRTWYAMAKKHQWRLRAQLWDRDERRRQRDLDRRRAVQAHNERLAMIEKLLGAVFTTLQIADLDAMDVSEARSRLPAIRMLFRDLIHAQREELGMPDESVEDGNDDVANFSADELIAAQRELQKWLDEQGDSVDKSTKRSQRDEAIG